MNEECEINQAADLQVKLDRIAKTVEAQQKVIELQEREPVKLTWSQWA